CDCSNKDCDQQACRQYDECRAKNSYGLNKWIRYLDDTVIFEGIRYELANKKQVEDAFIKPTSPGEFIDRCKKLLEGSIFDCDAFSKEPPNNMRCKDGDKVVEGCDEGNFFVKVSLTDPDVYPNLPRIVASDGFGNEIRSSAIGEEEYFYLPINYPLFKYYDNAFVFYSDLEEKNKQTMPSVPEGTCVAGAKETNGVCTAVPEYKDKGYDPVIQGDAEKAQEKLEGDLFMNKIKPACEVQNKPNKPDLRTLQLCTDANSCGSSEDGAEAWKIDCDKTEMSVLQDGGNALTAEKKTDVTQGGPAAFYEMIKVAARFTDKSPVHQVDPQAPNRFCAYVYQGHVCETGTDANGFKKVGGCSGSGTS
ncbi:hypothetical protein H0N96_01640, partial [Candidatus Micrarchaeota archaeon]|nr:hypothetical protein [Candidatus Micrarchaeota archaeon]